MAGARQPGSQSKHAKWWFLSAVAIGVVVVVALFDWNWFRTPLASYLSHRSGRTVSIDGNLHVELAWAPRLVIEGVTFGNAPWSAEPVMARADRVSLRVDLASLWHRPAVLSEVVLTRPDIILEKDRDRRPNWERSARCG